MLCRGTSRRCTAWKSSSSVSEQPSSPSVLSRSQIGMVVAGAEEMLDGAVRSVAEDDAAELFDDRVDAAPPDAVAEALAEANEDSALGRCSSAGMVVRRVSHWFSSGVKERRRSPRPSRWLFSDGRGSG